MLSRRCQNDTIETEVDQWNKTQSTIYTSRSQKPKSAVKSKTGHLLCIFGVICFVVYFMDHCFTLITEYQPPLALFKEHKVLPVVHLDEFRDRHYSCEYTSNTCSSILLMVMQMHQSLNKRHGVVQQAQLAQCKNYNCKDSVLMVF